jgi:hypothetical protein
MAYTLMMVIALGAAEPAPAPGADAPHPPETVASTDGAASIELEVNTVKKPGYGLGVRDVAIQKGPETYKLQARSWNEIVRDDPDLSLLDRRGRMLGGGITMTAIGGGWLMISTAVALDGHYARSAVGGLFQWILPSMILSGGAIMTITALSARRRLRAAQRKIHVAPYATGGTAGVTLAGRF